MPNTKPRTAWKAAGWALLAVGVIFARVWSEELGTAGRPAQTAVFGALTFVAIAAGLALLWRTHPGTRRRGRIAYRAALVACAAAAVVAIVVPLATAATTTGTVTATMPSAVSGSGYRVSPVVELTSDAYHLTTMVVTVHAAARTAPLLTADVAFDDGTRSLTCVNSRPIRITGVASITLHCDGFVSVSALRTVSKVAVATR